MRTFYICSYGGSGSWMMTRFLAKYGTSHHVHSRRPPEQICTVEGEHFTNTPVDNEGEYDVIYMYSAPEYSIHCNNSFNTLHWRNVQMLEEDVNRAPTSRQQYVDQNIDYVKYEDFFNNYYNRGSRQFDVICIRTERLWDNIGKLSGILNISFDGFPENKYANKPKEFPLMPVYDAFRNKLNNIDDITIT